MTLSILKINIPTDIHRLHNLHILTIYFQNNCLTLPNAVKLILAPFLRFENDFKFVKINWEE